MKLAATGTHSFEIDPGRTATVNAVIVDATTGGTLQKSGTGLLTLTGTNTYTGSTTITGGTLALSATSTNNIATSSAIIVGDSLANNSAILSVTGLTGGRLVLGANQSLKGHGTVNGAVTVAGTSSVSPGNSVGTLTSGSEAWEAGGKYVWEVADVSLAAGTGYDLLQINGDLDTTVATNGNPFTIQISRLSGSPAETQTFAQGSWYTVANVTGSVTGFDALKFALPDAGGGQTWDVRSVQQGGVTAIQVSAVPEPSAVGILLLGVTGLLARRRRQMV